jgi:hypothetical protein
MADRVRLTGELLQALVHAFANERKVQKKFRYAVVGALARLEGGVGAIHGFQLSTQKRDPYYEENVERGFKTFRRNGRAT